MAAFQAEHQEFLAGIRAILSAAEEERINPGDPRLNEAYRLAHSLKGGARVCDLREIETLSHRLETLLQNVQDGARRLEGDVVAVIHQALDAVEDYMAALAQGQTPGEPAAALDAIDQLFEGWGAPPAAPAAEQGIAGKLRAAFQSEYPPYLAQLRGILDEAEQGAAAADDFREALRLANNLKGAAEAAELTEVARLGHSLELVFSAVEKQELALEGEALAAVRAALAAVEEERDGRRSDRLPPAVARLQSLLGSPSEKRAAAPGDGTGARTAQEALPRGARPTSETVRVSTHNLDRLLRSSAQLYMESACQDQVYEALQHVDEQIAQLLHEREALGRGAAAALRRLAAAPEYRRVADFLDGLHHQLRRLAKQAKRAGLLQKRSGQAMASLGERVQQDVRRARMAPAESVFQGLRKTARDTAEEEGKQIEFHQSGLETEADLLVLQALKDPVMNLLRNAVAHGIEEPRWRREVGKPESGQVRLTVSSSGNRLQVVVEDDGHGLDVKRIAEIAVCKGLLSAEEAAAASPGQLARLIFHPGFTTSKFVSELSGRGMGLSVVDEAARKLQGEVEVRRGAGGRGTLFRVSVPVSIATHRLLFVGAAGATYAVPLNGIERLARLRPQAIRTVKGHPWRKWPAKTCPWPRSRRCWAKMSPPRNRRAIRCPSSCCGSEKPVWRCASMRFTVMETR